MAEDDGQGHGTADGAGHPAKETWVVPLKGAMVDNQVLMCVAFDIGSAFGRNDRGRWAHAFGIRKQGWKQGDASVYSVGFVNAMIEACGVELKVVGVVSGPGCR